MSKAFRSSLWLQYHFTLKGCVLFDLIKSISNCTYLLHGFNFQRADKLLRNHISQSKVMVARSVIKRNICWYEKLCNYRKPWYLLLQLQDISAETAIFMATKHEKTYMAFIQIRMIISFTSNFLPEI